jgi:cytochrome P450
LDEASEFLFGETVNALEKEHSEFTTAFNYAQMITAWRFRVPAWRLLIPQRRFKREIKVLDAFVYKIIDNAIARKEERLAEQTRNQEEEDEEERHTTLLDHFLSYQKENEVVTKEYLRDMLLNFLIAGRDTVKMARLSLRC